MQGSAASPDERTAGTGAVVMVALIGALLVLVSQFVALYSVRVATSSAPLKTVGTGANHGWAPIPIALVCLALVLAVFRHGNRVALLGLVALGVVTLVIALAVDLPDVHATGLIGSGPGVLQRAANRPAAGLYLETLGAVLLLVSGGVGFLMLGGGSARIALPGVGRRARAATSRRSRPAPGRSTPRRRTRFAPSATAGPSATGANPGPTAADPGPTGAGPSATGANPGPTGADPGPTGADPSAPEADPSTPQEDPAAPHETPSGPKGPLTLGDRPRRRWSAS